VEEVRKKVEEFSTTGGSDAGGKISDFHQDVALVVGACVR
jgi:hypothetical protein